MFKYLLQGCVLFISISLFGQTGKLPKLKTGSWTARLQLTEKETLPFQLVVDKTNQVYEYIVVNGSEQIKLDPDYKKDTIILSFPSFNSRLVLKKGKKEMSGYWQNFNKGNNYKIPLTISHGYTHRFSSSKLYLSNIRPADFNGRWECTFEPETPDAYKAVGLFDQSSTRVTGTFLSETGDYRFLEGNVIGDSIYLSGFDGSHAFLFNGSLKNQKINGNFFSGKHWQTTWIGIRNENFELRHPDSLTYLVKQDPFTFTLKDVNGQDFTFPNQKYDNKVTIIQIMGTWCPNCLDETVYLKDLYKTYHSDGLEVISIGYEVGSGFEDYAMRINRLKEKLDLPFTFLVGGSANKGLASEQFSMLNQIISFPTAIIIGKDGTVKKVHTGFNGPGTGSHYEVFVKENEAFIKQLLVE